MERLQKYMASCGIASRRKCEDIILDGRVMVNGAIVNKLGFKVDISKDTVKVDGKIIKQEERKVYIALNKPEGIICSANDDRNRKTVIDIVNIKERIYPVGRLDYDTSGLIILTNDGEVYNKIVHPKYEKEKTYVAEIVGKFNEDQLDKFRTGIDIGDYVTSRATAREIKEYRNTSIVEIKIHEGKNRQVRRMCETLGHPVVTLKRVAIGNLKLGNLKLGEWIYLEKDRIYNIFK